MPFVTVPLVTVPLETVPFVTTTSRPSTSTATTTTTTTTAVFVDNDTDFGSVGFDGDWGRREGDIRPVFENASVGYRVATLPSYQDDSHLQHLTTYALMTDGAAAAGRRQRRADAPPCDLSCINGGQCVLTKADCSDPNAAYNTPVCDCGAPASGVCFYGGRCQSKVGCNAGTLGFAARSCSPHTPQGRGRVDPAAVCTAEATAPALCVAPAAAFAVNGSTGRVTVAAPLDYETNPYHLLAVRLTASGDPTLPAKQLLLNISILPSPCPSGAWSATGSFPCGTWSPPCALGQFEEQPPTQSGDRLCGSGGSDMEKSAGGDDGVDGADGSEGEDAAGSAVSFIVPIAVVVALAVLLLGIAVLRKRSEREEREKAEKGTGLNGTGLGDLDERERPERAAKGGELDGIEGFDGLATFLEKKDDPDYQAIADAKKKEGVYQAVYPMAKKADAPSDEFDAVLKGVYALSGIVPPGEPMAGQSYDQITGETSDGDDTDDETKYDMGGGGGATYDTAGGGATYDTAGNTQPGKGGGATYDTAGGQGDIYDTATHTGAHESLYETATQGATEATYSVAAETRVGMADDVYDVRTTTTRGDALYDTACGIEAGSFNPTFLRKESGKESIYAMAANTGGAEDVAPRGRLNTWDVLRRTSEATYDTAQQQQMTLKALGKKLSGKKAGKGRAPALAPADDLYAMGAADEGIYALADALAASQTDGGSSEPNSRGQSRSDSRSSSPDCGNTRRLSSSSLHQMALQRRGSNLSFRDSSYDFFGVAENQSALVRRSFVAALFWFLAPGPARRVACALLCPGRPWQYCVWSKEGSPLASWCAH